MLRQGRLTRAQKLALESHWNTFGIDPDNAPLDLDAAFHRAAPVVLEIGSGMGATTATLARLHPENNYLAVEVHRPGVGALLKLAHDQGLSNIRVIMHDATEVLRRQIPENSLDEVYILFPDPWPKKRHHKRRLVNAAFLDLLLPAMKENARLLLATDAIDLARYLLEVCDTHPGLLNLAGPGNFAPTPAWRGETKFERRGRRLQHEIRDLIYVPLVPSNKVKEVTAGNSQGPRGGR